MVTPRKKRHMIQFVDGKNRKRLIRNDASTGTCTLTFEIVGEALRVIMQRKHVTRSGRVVFARQHIDLFGSDRMILDAWLGHNRWTPMYDTSPDVLHILSADIYDGVLS